MYVLLHRPDASGHAWEELSQFINEAKTPGNLLQDAPDFDAIKQEEYENEGMDVIDVNEEDDNRN